TSWVTHLPGPLVAGVAVLDAMTGFAVERAGVNVWLGDVVNALGCTAQMPSRQASQIGQRLAPSWRALRAICSWTLARASRGFSPALPCSTAPGITGGLILMCDPVPGAPPELILIVAPLRLTPPGSSFSQLPPPLAVSSMPASMTTLLPAW